MPEWAPILDAAIPGTGRLFPGYKGKPPSLSGKQRSRLLAPQGPPLPYQGSQLQSDLGRASGALAPAVSAFRGAFGAIGDPAIPGSAAGMDPGVPVSPSYQQGSSRLTENVKPQSIMDDLGSLRIPYNTEGRRQSTNVEDRRPQTMFEGMSSGIDQRMRNTPGMYLPGGVQGPLPNVGRGVNDPGRIAAVGDMFDLANIPIPERAVGPLRDARYARGASDLANDIAARRAAGMGVGRPPTEQEEAAYNAAVQERLANPEPGSLSDFTRGEYGRTEQGRNDRREAMDQSYLSKPMQGGGMPMADREARLSMLSPPGQRSPSQAVGDRRTQSRSVADATIREELMRQGKYTQEDLDSIAELRGDPDIALGGRRAVSLLAPGTSIRTPEGGFVMRGPDRQTTPEDLERRAAGRLRDRLAPQERMDRVRAGRQAMMANRAAMERQQFDMATNPLVNPMLVAGNPQAMAAVIQGRNEMAMFGANEPVRKSEIALNEAREKGVISEGDYRSSLLELQKSELEAGGPLRQQQIAASRAQQLRDETEAANLKAQTELLGDPERRTTAELQGAINDLQGATDPASVASRGRLTQMLTERIERGMGQESPLLPPNVRQPATPNPETGRVDTEQVKAKIEQLAAYGMKGPELAAQLEALGVDRASLADFLRNEFRDMRWPRSSGPREYVEAGRSLREIFGIKNDFMGYGR